MSLQRISCRLLLLVALCVCVSSCANQRPVPTVSLNPTPTPHMTPYNWNQAEDTFNILTVIAESICLMEKNKETEVDADQREMMLGTLQSLNEDYDRLFHEYNEIIEHAKSMGFMPPPHIPLQATPLDEMKDSIQICRQDD